jgi:hypothetical protein
MTPLQIFPQFFQTIQMLLAADGGVFVATGQGMCHWFSILSIIYFGINSAQRAEQGGSFSFVGFGKLLIYISLVYTAVTFYMTPIPWLGGQSFTGLITGTAHWAATIIGMNESEVLISRLATAKASIEVPLVGSILIYICYGIVWVEMTLLEVLVFVVIGWGFLAEAVCVLIGPLLIPFALLPRLDGFFWNWFRCFVQYSAFQVVAAAVIWVIGNTLVPNMNVFFAQGVTVGQLVANCTGLLAMLGIGVFGILAIPSLVSHIFSGSVGSNHGWIYGAVSRLI